MLIARRYGGMSLRKIGEAVGGLQYPDHERMNSFT